MRIVRSLVVAAVFILLSASSVRAEDLSKYRGFAFGMTLAQLSGRIDRNPQDATSILRRPAVIQEVTWWPSQGTRSAPLTEAAQQVVFSFYNGELYRISVAYDRDATEGLTVEDMVRSISARYGAVAEFASATHSTGTPDAARARWENSDFRFELFHSSWSDFRLEMVSKSLETKALVAAALALSLDKAEAPAKEAQRQLQEAQDLELARQKNKKIFRP